LYTPELDQGHATSGLGTYVLWHAEKSKFKKYSVAHSPKS